MNNNKMINGICAFLGIAIVGVCVWGLTRPNQAEAVTVPTNGNAEVIVQERVVENFVQVERTITGEMIQEDIRDMGFLVTQEYSFTEVISYEKIKNNLLWLDGKSSYIASYDGVITAGIDFEQIEVSKNDDAKTVDIVIPEAAIQAVDVDPESFILYSESNSWGSRITAEEYNDSLVALETQAKEKAIEKGLLTKANENAQTIIRNFVGGLVDPTEYKISITVAFQ